MSNDDDYDETPIEQGRGRSARKREVKAIADLAKRMVEAPDGVATNLPLSSELRAALMQTRAITTRRQALKRQIKYFAGLLRQDEEAAMAAKAVLDSLERGHFEDISDFKKLESMRDELLDPEQFNAAMQRVCEELPSLDRREISSLARSAHKKPSKKLARAIFRTLRAAMEERENPE